MCRHERYAWLLLWCPFFPGDLRPCPKSPDGHWLQHWGVGPGASAESSWSWRSSKTVVQGSCWTLLALAWPCNVPLCGTHCMERGELDGNRCGTCPQSVAAVLGYPWSFLNTSTHKLTQALRSQTRSGSGTQKKLKIFESSCPRQLLMLACTWDFQLCGKHCTILHG